MKSLDQFGKMTGLSLADSTASLEILLLAQNICGRIKHC